MVYGGIVENATDAKFIANKIVNCQNVKANYHEYIHGQ